MENKADWLLRAVYAVSYLTGTFMFGWKWAIGVALATFVGTALVSLSIRKQLRKIRES